jgi:DNA modification methylase
VGSRKLTRGQRNIDWIEGHCRIPEGRFVGQPVKLRPWQQEIIRGIYDQPTRRAIISFGRKNAKSTLSAWLLLLHLCGTRRDRIANYSAPRRAGATLWFFDKPARNDLHPTMKPVALVERAICNSSKMRDIVLDPFGGSGSTRIACENPGVRRGWWSWIRNTAT